MKRLYLLLLGNLSDLSVGECYHYGRHVEKDLVMARKYYLSAVQNGELHAYEQLMQLYIELKNPRDAFLCKGIVHEQKGEWLEALTAYEHSALPEAFFRLSLLFQNDLYEHHDHSKPPCLRKNRERELYWLRQAAVHYSKQAINRLMVESHNKADIAFLYGQMMERGEITPLKNNNEALKYYFIAAKLGNSDALNSIEKLSGLCTDAMLLELAILYSRIFNNMDKSLKLLIILSDKNYLPAQLQLKRLTQQNSLYAVQIGELYEQNGAIEKAIPYFMQACQLSDKNALAKMEQYTDCLSQKTQLEFAQLCCKLQRNVQAVLIYKKIASLGHQDALNEMNRLANKDPKCAHNLALQFDKEQQTERAYPFYLLAVENQHPQSTQILELLHTRAIAKDPIAQYYLGCVYYTKRKMMSEAVNWALQSAAQQYLPAQTYLEQTNFNAELLVLIAQKYERGEEIQRNEAAAYQFYLKAVEQKDPNAAFWLAEHYFNQEQSEQGKLKAYPYLTKAALWNHTAAQDKLEYLAQNGVIEAQYYLGCGYLHHRQSHIEATRWAMLAASQGHERAEMYLRNTLFSAEIYKIMAQRYEQSNSTLQNITKAVYYYTKAIHLKDKDAAVQLAELYLMHEEIQENKSEAFLALVGAVRLGHKDSLLTLECIANDVAPDLLIHLGDLYQHPPFTNQAKAIYWFQQACDFGCSEAERFLSNLKQ